MRIAFFLAFICLALLTYAIIQPEQERQPVSTGTGAALPEPPARTEKLHLLVLDRTTALNGARRWLTAGVDRLLSSASLAGPLEILEIRERSVGYVPIAEVDVPELTPSPVRGALVSCSPPQGEYVSQPERETYAACLHENDLASDAFLAAQEIYKTALAERATTIEKARAEIASFIAFDSETDALTEIRMSLMLILTTRCRSASCSVSIFSDLLDTRVKNDVVLADVSEEVAGRLGREDAGGPFGIDGESITFEVVAWGLGRSDANSDEELTMEQRGRLIAYWEGFFRAWGARSISFGLEFPR